MCTVTIIKHKNSTVVTMNRDEVHERLESSPINQDITDTLQCWYPVDATSGGTWFGVNSSGVVMALLNRYQESNLLAVHSRGNLIPELLKCTSNAECIGILNQFRLEKYAPFTLIIIHGDELERITWNGKRLKRYAEDTTVPFIVTSSSSNLGAVTEWRVNAFYTFLKTSNSQTEQALLDFHQQQQPDNLSYSVNMQRVGRHTKSIVQAVVTDASIKTSYLTRADLSQSNAPFVKSSTANLLQN